MRSPLTRRQVLLQGAQLAGGMLLASTLPEGALAETLPGSFGKVSPYIVRSMMVTRLPSLTREAFIDRWRNQHAPLYKDTPGLARHVLNIASPSLSQNFPYDGVAQFWFENGTAMLNAFDTGKNPAAARCAASAAQLLQPDLPVIVSREIVIRELSRDDTPLIKRIGLLNLGEGYTRERFAQEWRDEHAPRVNRMANLKGYTVNIVDSELSPQTPWAGFASLWWPKENAGGAKGPPPPKGDPFAPALALVGEELVLI